MAGQGQQATPTLRRHARAGVGLRRMRDGTAVTDITGLIHRPSSDRIRLRALPGRME